MKKNYIAPELMELNVVTEQMVAASIPVIGGGKEADTDDPGTQLSGGRRGEWGDLWK